jgi:hypothetical protein
LRVAGSNGENRLLAREPGAVARSRGEARRALAVARVDRRAEFLPWRGGDCELAVNPDSEWGGVLGRLSFSPALVCHIPDLAFVLSGPLDQPAGAAALTRAKASEGEP